MTSQTLVRVVPSTAVVVADKPKVRIRVRPVRRSEIKSEALIMNWWYGTDRYRADVRTWGRTIGCFALTNVVGFGMVAIGAPTWVWWATIPAGLAVAANEHETRILWEK